MTSEYDFLAFVMVILFFVLIVCFMWLLEERSPEAKFRREHEEFRRRKEREKVAHYHATECEYCKAKREGKLQ